MMTSLRNRRLHERWVLLALLALPMLLGGSPGASGAAEGILKGDPFHGRALFSEKGCARCHSVWGHGGSLGPDIAVAVKGKTFFELVGDFWNHTPRMMQEVSEAGHEWPVLEPREMADTLSYLYYLHLFDEPGDPIKGINTYARLQCGQCHSLASVGGRVGGPLDRFGMYPSPGPLAQAMWNAGPRMRAEQIERGRPIPQFTGDEIADLQAFIRAEGLRKGREIVLEPLPDPVRGAETYRRKRCGVCHDDPRGKAPDLQRSALSKTVSEITGLLWNHAYAMGEQMADWGIPFPEFEGTELSDLIAHLYFLGYAGAPGDPLRGAVVFSRRGCAGCHEGGIEGVPSLAGRNGAAGRVELAAAMWNHAPQMHRLMAERSPFWPKFEPGEMRDLAAYLEHLSSVSE